jgi:hypothetical protein
MDHVEELFVVTVRPTAHMTKDGNGDPQSWLVKVQVDVRGLAYAMGPTAVRSRGGRSVEAGGLVKVTRVRKVA